MIYWIQMIQTYWNELNRRQLFWHGLFLQIPIVWQLFKHLQISQANETYTQASTASTKLLHSKCATQCSAKDVKKRKCRLIDFLIFPQ